MKERNIFDAESFREEALKTYESQQTHRNNDVVMVMPFKTGMTHVYVWRSHDNVQRFMNQKLMKIDVTRKEVGDAYNSLIDMAIEDIRCADFPWIMTNEEDNIVPENMFRDLFAGIRSCIDCGEPITDEINWRCKNGHKGLDAISGLYFTKSDPGHPMAFGDPKNGPDDFRTQSVAEAIRESRVIEVNGIAQGCTLFRKDLFRRVSKPWFKTLDGEDGMAVTQDLYFCRKAKAEAGARFGVHTGVKVGHMDFATGRIF